jgi:hypothetical protein
MPYHVDPSRGAIVTYVDDRAADIAVVRRAVAVDPAVTDPPTADPPALSGSTRTRHECTAATAVRHGLRRDSSGHTVIAWG